MPSGSDLTAEKETERAHRMETSTARSSGSGASTAGVFRQSLGSVKETTVFRSWRRGRCRAARGLSFTIMAREGGWS
jgi:hypothetical protein